MCSQSAASVAAWLIPRHRQQKEEHVCLVCSTAQVRAMSSFTGCFQSCLFEAIRSHAAVSEPVGVARTACRACSSLIYQTCATQSARPPFACCEQQVCRMRGDTRNGTWGADESLRFHQVLAGMHILRMLLPAQGAFVTVVCRMRQARAECIECVRTKVPD